MRRTSTAALVAIVCLAGPWTAFGGIEVSLRGGRVSIAATQATAGEILAEWAKQGQVKVTNVELLPGERMTIELRDVTEQQALAVVLRRATGYVAARREGDDPALSTFDRIVVMRQLVPVPVLASAKSTAPVRAAEAEPTAGDDPDDAASPDVPAAQAAGQPSDPGAVTPPRFARGRAEYRAAVAAGEEPEVPDVSPPAFLMTDGVRTSPPTPARPMMSGQMAGRRPTGSPRDAVPTAAPPVADGTNAEFDPTPSFNGPLTLPADDQVAQAMFKARRAIETVDPRTFNYKAPKDAGKAGASTGAPSTGAAVPGVIVPTPPNPIIK
jgi:hypothetical protein